MVKNYPSFTCILAIWAATAAVSSGARSVPSAQPPAGVDCSTVIFNMMDCISYLTSGGDETTPDNECCSGFSTVLKLDADCICYALSNADSLGLDINMTKAEALPSQCGVSAPPINNCNVPTSPSASPANAPSSIAPPSNSTTLPPATPPSVATPSPAESPEAPPPAQSPESPSPAVAPETPSGAPSEATAPAPAKSGDYTMSKVYSGFLMAIASNFLVCKCLSLLP